MTNQKKPSAQGELRRRWRAMLDDGSIAKLRSEGRLVALYVLYAADFKTCEVRCSLRHVARTLGVQVTAVRRGMTQLVAAGVVERLGKSEKTGRGRFLIVARAPSVRAQDTSGARSMTQSVRAQDTSGARSEHDTCLRRARTVSKARTLCARNSILSSGISINTNGDTNLASPCVGLEPTQASQMDEEKNSRVS